jgi:CRP-like cAMP-binding protein
MFIKKDLQNNQLAGAIRKCPIFEEFSAGDMKKILNISHIRDYSAGEKLFEEGTIGLCFYIIVKGSAMIATEKEGKLTILKEFGEGAYFSEVHLFSETYHTVSCIAKEVTRAIVLAKPDFEDFVKINPRLGSKLLLKFLDFFGQKLDKLYKENRELKQNYPA